VNRRPAVNGAPEETTARRSFPSLARHPHLIVDLPRCELCDREVEPAWPGSLRCAGCVRDLTDALDRRRAAELRLPPLDRGQS
jgi:hypothetical protein